MVLSGHIWFRLNYSSDNHEYLKICKPWFKFYLKSWIKNLRWHIYHHITQYMSIEYHHDGSIYKKQTLRKVLTRNLLFQKYWELYLRIRNFSLLIYISHRLLIERNTNVCFWNTLNSKTNVRRFCYSAEGYSNNLRYTNSNRTRHTLVLFKLAFRLFKLWNFLFLINYFIRISFLI